MVFVWPTSCVLSKRRYVFIWYHWAIFVSFESWAFNWAYNNSSVKTFGEQMGVSALLIGSFGQGNVTILWSHIWDYKTIPSVIWNYKTKSHSLLGGVNLPISKIFVFWSDYSWFEWQLKNAISFTVLLLSTFFLLCLMCINGTGSCSSVLSLTAWQVALVSLWRLSLCIVFIS